MNRSLKDGFRFIVTEPFTGHFRRTEGYVGRERGIHEIFKAEPPADSHAIGYFLEWSNLSQFAVIR